VKLLFASVRVAAAAVVVAIGVGFGCCVRFD
jgi:hypothetical protein